MKTIKFYYGFREVYAKAALTWVKKYLIDINYALMFDFITPLCEADWSDKEERVREAYNKLIRVYSSDYKALTEIVVCINLLSWFNEKLRQEGFAKRGFWVDFYADLYYEARDLFYDKFGDNNEASEYFFGVTD